MNLSIESIYPICTLEVDKAITYNKFHIVLGSLVFYQFLLSPHVKRCAIIGNNYVYTSCLTTVVELLRTI